MVLFQALFENELKGGKYCDKIMLNYTNDTYIWYGFYQLVIHHDTYYFV